MQIPPKNFIEEKNKKEERFQLFFESSLQRNETNEVFVWDWNVKLAKRTNDLIWLTTKTLLKWFDE